MRESTSSKSNGSVGGGGGLRSVAVDLFAGSVGGAAGVVVGQPLDVIKVRYQMILSAASSSAAATTASGVGAAVAAPPSSYAHVVGDIWKARGIKGFFRGIGPPVCGQALYSAICFAGFNGCLAALAWTQGASGAPTKPDGSMIFSAGCGAGMMTTLVNVPCELVKIQLQVDMVSGTKPKYQSSVACARQMLQRGGPRALYAGWLATALRDVPTSGLYFLVYHACKERLLEDASFGRVTAELIAGGVSGVLSWGTAVPCDVIKTHIQADAGRANRKYAGVVDCAQKLYAKDGIAAFTRGALPVIVRSFPVNAVTFMVYERVLDASRKFTSA